MQNLLENAVLYAGEDASVTVGARAWNDGTRIWVEDEVRAVPRTSATRSSRSSTGGTAPPATRRRAPGSASRSRVRSCAATAARICVEDVVPHGARFVIALPSDAVRPDAAAEEDA